MEKKSNTVLIITSHFPPNLGGIESHLNALVNVLVKHHWNVLVSTYQPLASNKSAPSLEKRKGLTIYRMPWIGFNVVHKLTNIPPLEFIYLFPGLLIMTTIILFKYRKEISVVHAQGLVPTAVGKVVSLIFNKKLISSIHNLYFFPTKGVYPKVAKIIFSSSDQILSPTGVVTSELIRIGVPKEKIKKFSYWLSLDTFKVLNKVSLREKLGWNKFTVFFVGRLIETKGVGIILRLIEVLDPRIQIVVAGDGSMKEQLVKAQVDHKNLTYLGRIENTDLHTYYNASDLVIVPSLVDEGWGYTAMEAISCGTPVIASRVGGLSDVVSSKVGRLVSPTVKSFKKWIEYYFLKRKELTHLISQSRSYALSNFGNGNIKLILDAYGR